jgi:cyclic-di-AMP phosphodiesterase PgpH
MWDNFLNKVRDHHNRVLAIVMFGLCTAWIVYLFPREARFKYEFELGKTWQHEELSAPFEFALHKPQSVIDSTRAYIQSHSPAVYRIDPEIVGLQIRRFRELIESNWSEISGEANMTSGSLLNDSLERDHYLDSGIRILKLLYAEGIVAFIPEHQHQSASFPVVIIQENLATEVVKGQLLGLEEAVQRACNLCNAEEAIDALVLCPLLESAIICNTFFDLSKSEFEKTERLQSYSEFEGKVEKGVVLASPGDIITEHQFRILESFAENHRSRLGSVESYWIVMLGQFLLVALCMLSMALFIGMFNPDALSLPSRILFLLVLTLLVTIMAKFAMEVEAFNIYLAPVCILPIIIRTFYDARMALLVHVVVVFIISFIVPNPFEFVFLQIFTGILLLYGIRNLRSRSQFFKSSFVIFASYSITYFGWNVVQEGQLASMNWITYAWFGGNALLSLLAYPLIYLFERSFGFLSEVSLLELADTNTPLLRQLNEKAPGTFQHTIQVANLAEEAIRVIGGDVLLVRAGAMYHDVGKMLQPEYFIENQSGINPHNEMSPEESAKVIINHIASGIEIAKRHGVPDKIIDFIRTHHGTTRTEYFYRKALEDDHLVSPALYTYPGPRPFSKETAVLMMADSVEAASRSLRDVDKFRLERLINDIVAHQISLDQFKSSNLTFKDIGDIKSVFLKKLMSIYHVRIEYPSISSARSS